MTAFTVGEPRDEVETCWDVFADSVKVGEICQDASGVFEIELPDDEGQFSSLEAALAAFADCCDDDDLGTDMTDGSQDDGTPYPGGTGDGNGSMMPRSRVMDGLVRAMWSEPVELRADAEGDGSLMVGHFAVFNEWTEINSALEGRFLERVAPEAFVDEFTSRADKIRVLYDHGADPSIGNKPLGKIEVLRSDKVGAYAEVRLFDAGYVNDLKPAIRAGQLGQSFRFQVLEDQWDMPKLTTRDNPNRLEERTIMKVRLHEFGPVTFPAYAGATVGLRSRTDEIMARLVDDPLFFTRFVNRTSARQAATLLERLRAHGGSKQDVRRVSAHGGTKTVGPDDLNKWVSAHLYR
jgi:HK97 family phage prohead protease